MVGLGSELQTKAGPLPVWAWAGLGTAGLAGFLVYRKKKSMNNATAAPTDTQSSVAGGPSNLSVQAEPMPIQMGDTFVDTTINNIPPGGAQKVPPPTKKLPPVNAKDSPATISKNSALGKSMIKVGCNDVGGKYTGKQVSGGAPVYGLSTVHGMFAQGALAKSPGHCIYVPAQFKDYIVG